MHGLVTDVRISHWRATSTEPPRQLPSSPPFSMCRTDGLMSFCSFAPSAILSLSANEGTELCSQKKTRHAVRLCWSRHSEQQFKPSLSQQTIIVSFREDASGKHGRCRCAVPGPVARRARWSLEKPRAHVHKWRALELCRLRDLVVSWDIFLISSSLAARTSRSLCLHHLVLLASEEVQGDDVSSLPRRCLCRASHLVTSMTSELWLWLIAVARASSSSSLLGCLPCSACCME